jgi:hypothetical protein
VNWYIEALGYYHRPSTITGGLAKLAVGGRKAALVLPPVLIAPKGQINVAGSDLLQIDCISSPVGCGEILEEKDVGSPADINLYEEKSQSMIDCFLSLHAFHCFRLIINVRLLGSAY